MFQTTNQLNIFFGETNLMRKPRPLANTADEPHLHCMYSHLTSRIHGVGSQSSISPAKIEKHGVSTH